VATVTSYEKGFEGQTPDTPATDLPWPPILRNRAVRTLAQTCPGSRPRGALTPRSGRSYTELTD